MQNTTLCLISLNNACCCSDSSSLIHQNPLSHYSVIFDFSFDCLPVQFSRCAEGSYLGYSILRIVSAFPILQNDTVCKSTVKSYSLTSISVHQVWILCILRFLPLFLTSSFSRRCSTLESECLFQHPCLPRKEVIQPHLPIRLPCYDFTPVIGPAFGSSSLAVRSLTSGVTDSHGVTGGVYKTRERIHRGILIRDY